MDASGGDIIISPFFEVKQTSYGGRACFARKDFSKGTNVLVLDRCIGSSISHEFRKEVCHYCLKYDNGKTMKVKLDRGELVDSIPQDSTLKWTLKSKDFRGAGIWLCSESCREKYSSQNRIHELVETFEILLQHFQSQAKQRKLGSRTEEEHKLNSIQITQDIIDLNWRVIEKDWVPKIDHIKPTKKLSLLPVISEEEYECSRFVVESLFKLRYADPDSPSSKSFKSLQSNELNRIKKFPVLLDLQSKVFKTLHVLLPPFLRSQLTIELFRHILGSEYGNSFGIWQESESNDSREYLGFWIFPEASYFNHSCSPNIEKRRVGNKLMFISNRNVLEGEQLCIDYKGILSLDVEKRRQILLENWFFDCECQRCRLEMQAIH